MKSKMAIERWQDWGNLLLGAWLFASPIAMQFTESLPKAAMNAYIAGAIAMLTALLAVYIPKLWEEWINTAVGIWVALSPWVLGFAGSREVVINFVAIGVAMTVLAISAIVRSGDFKLWRRDRHQAT